MTTKERTTPKKVLKESPLPIGGATQESGATTMTRKERKTSPKVLKEVCLRAGGKWANGACFGGKCEICGNKKIDARGLKFMHKKRRKMGGTTSPKIHSPKNVFRSCYPCDEENDGVILPKTKVSDQEESRMAALTGNYGDKFRPVSVESQVGIRK